MQITLTTEKDIVEYIEYLHQTDSLLSLVNNVCLDDNDAENYLNYKITRHFSNTPTKMHISWTDSEDKVLQKSIEKNCSPSEIAAALQRSEGAIRSRAGKTFYKGYKSNCWYDYPKTKQHIEEN